MTYAELASESSRTLAEWCAKPHAGYGARIVGDQLLVWVDLGIRASTTVPMARLVYSWRNRVADTLRDLKQSFLED